jgi:YmgG-like glycine-zipper protein
MVIETVQCCSKNTDMKHTLIVISSLVLVASCKRKVAQTNSNAYPNDSAVYNNNYPSNNYDAQGTVKYSSPYNTNRTRVYHHHTYASTSSSPSQKTVVRKKGWSSAAKGTAIGAASGAVLGAVLSKDHHRAKGAVIGGAAGAAGGYLYGRHRDKKNGRY